MSGRIVQGECVNQGLADYDRTWRTSDILAALSICFLSVPLLAEGELMLDVYWVDDRSTGTLRATGGGHWRLLSDQVMGGRSSGELNVHRHLERACLLLEGDVSQANNGGFLQMTLELAQGENFDASKYQGIELEIAGNGESYSLHLRTADLWLPWQSYRKRFDAGEYWQKIRLPFDTFEPYRTGQKLRIDRLTRLGIAAIGREFHAEVCLGSVSLYQSNDATADNKANADHAEDPNARAYSFPSHTSF